MTGNILVLDSVATNRIVMKVKLVSAQYQVLTAETCDQALELMAQEKPDLLLINLSDPTEDSHKFCRKLKTSAQHRDIAIIAFGVADTNRARFAALDSGADDVLPRPISDALMLARIRGLLRRRIANLEWDIRDETSRALGFEEMAAPILTLPSISYVCSESNRTDARIKLLSGIEGSRLSVRSPEEAVSQSQAVASQDLFIIEAAAAEDCQLISDIYSRPASRNSQILVIAPKGQNSVAVLALDLGAGDVVFDNISSEEMAIRATNLIRHKRRQDQQKEQVLSGLQAATIDPLTGLYNRRYAESYLDQIAAQAYAKRQSYALLIFDIDHFKKINDHYGHASGDLVLKSMAQRLKANFRSVDLIARIGGEEFLVAMPETTLSQAKTAAERLRKLVNRETFALKGGFPPVEVTISAGIAVDELTGKRLVPPDVLFGQADAALYRAKSSGRDQVALGACAA